MTRQILLLSVLFECSLVVAACGSGTNPTHVAVTATPASAPVTRAMLTAPDVGPGWHFEPDLVTSEPNGTCTTFSGPPVEDSRSVGFVGAAGHGHLFEWAGTFKDLDSATSLVTDQSASVSGCGDAFVRVDPSHQVGDQSVIIRQRLGSLDALIMVFRSGPTVVLLDYVMKRPTSVDDIERFASVILSRLQGMP